MQIIFIAFIKVSQNLIGLQRFYEFDGVSGNTTSTLKVPLLPVGLLLELLNKAMRYLSLGVGTHALLFRAQSTHFSV